MGVACKVARKSVVHLILAEVGTSPRITCAGMGRVMGGVMSSACVDTTLSVAIATEM